MPRKGILCPEGEVERVEEVERAFKQWQLFAKMEELNYIHHREVYPLLHQFLGRLSRPFTLLDLGCGDAGFMAQTLQGTAIAHYVGVDLSKVALALAEKNLAVLQCRQQLLEKDYYEVARAAEIKAEVIWLGLTFHHLPQPQKASFLHWARQILPDGGYLLMYEPTLLEDEDRDQFLARSWQISCSWTGLTETEVEKLRQHIATCDFPEKLSTLEHLARQQGFSGLTLLYQDPEKICTLVCLAA
jgi:2-polyprenyl-3-methyl-5-hydroxy-6-metoxy-1,4-benzoquinol methylase